MKLRRALPADAVAIAGIEKSVTRYPWSLAQVLSSCRHELNHVLVMEAEDGSVAGFAVCQVVVGEATLLNIAVAPGVQGRGVGAALLQGVLRAAASVGGERCLLEVRCGNERAIALYRGHGFAEDGVRKNYYPAENGREDALLMSLDLVVEL